MKREPAAMAQTRKVRVAANALKKDDSLPSLFGCMSFRRQENRGFAQSSLINVDSHGVASGL